MGTGYAVMGAPSPAVRLAGLLAAFIPSGVPRPGGPGGMGRFASSDGRGQSHFRCRRPGWCLVRRRQQGLTTFRDNPGRDDRPPRPSIRRFRLRVFRQWQCVFGDPVLSEGRTSGGRDHPLELTVRYFLVLFRALPTTEAYALQKTVFDFIRFSGTRWINNQKQVLNWTEHSYRNHLSESNYKRSSNPEALGPGETSFRG